MTQPPPWDGRISPPELLQMILNLCASVDALAVLTIESLAQIGKMDPAALTQRYESMKLAALQRYAPEALEAVSEHSPEAKASAETPAEADNSPFAELSAFIAAAPAAKTQTPGPPRPKPPGLPDFLKINPGAPPAEGESEVQMLVGTWGGNTQSFGRPCYCEDTYNADNTYMASLNCYGSVTWQKGNWHFVQPGVLQRQIVDWGPRTYGGQPVHMISQETFQVRFLDRNRLAYGNELIMNRIV